MKKQKISDAVIHRLPRYYRYLDDLYNKGVVRISSNSLGTKMDITASQIRQDLSCFGEFGQQGYGYNVAELRSEIGHILGIDKGHRLIVIGVGHLGHALLQNFDFEKVGFRIELAQMAERLELTGWVQNEDDGSVTLEVQGSPDQFMQLFAMIQKSDYIRITGIREKDLPPDPWERGFSVRVY